MLQQLEFLLISGSIGMSTPDQLNLYGTRYNTALVIFFVPYCIFEIPSNILLKRFRPNVWLSGCMFMFGLVSICQGLVSSYGGLLTTRFFLGLFETGMFPGCKCLLILLAISSESGRCSGHMRTCGRSQPARSIFPEMYNATVRSASMVVKVSAPCAAAEGMFLVRKDAMVSPEDQDRPENSCSEGISRSAYPMLTCFTYRLLPDWDVVPP